RPCQTHIKNQCASTNRAKDRARWPSTVCIGETDIIGVQYIKFTGYVQASNYRRASRIRSLELSNASRCRIAKGIKLFTTLCFKKSNLAVRTDSSTRCRRE